MSIILHPEIQRKVEAFGARRRRLIMLRGVFAALTAWICAMTVVAFADYVFLLEDHVRWSLSAAAYAAVVVVLWITCLRWLWQKTDRKSLARFFENRQPELHEDLVSAVELGDPALAEQWDSEEFRSYVQQDVSGRVRPLRVEDLLPRSLIVKWSRAAAISAVACVILLAMPGLYYYRLILRAAVPSANIERVSKVKIRIVAPDPAETVVPKGDTVSVVVELSGPETDEAFLESFREDGDRSRVRMQLIGKHRYSAGLAVGRESLFYRVRAGDGITRKYALTAFDRPHVVTFKKIYHYPAYAHLDDREVVESSGDLEALENTDVRLVLQVDQPVRAADLEVAMGEGKTSILLKPANNNTLEASLKLNVSGTYRVNLEARDTFFKNKFSPEYEIRAHADLVPAINIDSPDHDLVIPPDEVVDVEATAKDDLELTEVSQMYRVNGGTWRTKTILAGVGKPEVKVRHRWDLFELGITPGDSIITKFVAKDLKGNQGESSVLRLTVSSPGFDPERLKSLEAKLKVGQSLEKLREAAAVVKQTSESAMAEIAGAAEDSLKRKQELLRMAAATEKAVREAESVQESIRNALRQTRTTVAAADLVMLGRAVSQLQRDLLEKAKAQLEHAEDLEDGKVAGAAVEEAGNALREAEPKARALDEAFDRMLASDEAEAITQDLAQLAAEQSRITDAAARLRKDRKFTDQVSRRQFVAVDHAKSVEDMMQDLAKTATQPSGQQVDEVRKQLEQARSATESAMAQAQKAAQGQPEEQDVLKPEQAEQMKKGVESALAGMEPITRRLGEEADKGRQEIAKAVTNASNDLKDLQSNVQQMAKKAETKDSPEKQAMAAKVDSEWKAAVDQLKDRASLEELRRDADQGFVHDMAQTADALKALKAASPSPEQMPMAVQPLDDLQKAFKALEAGHELKDAANRLADLAAREHWEGQDPKAAREMADEWQRIDENMKPLPEKLAQAGIPPESGEQVSQAHKGQDAEASRKEMAARQQTGKPTASIAEPLQEMSRKMEQARQAAQPAMDDARKLVAKAAPPLSRQMAGLAEAAKKLQQNTDGLQKDAGKTDVPHVGTEADKLLAKQEDLNDKIDNLRDALRHDANAQDLGQKEGRERARDADDAMAMLRQPPPRAEDLLREAAAAQEPKAQSSALHRASEQQQKMTDTLAQLAKHYDNLEQGKPHVTRPELRRAEDEMGLAKALDREYERAKLSDEDQKASPLAKLADLENELARNETMREELDKLAENLRKEGTEAMDHVAAEEEKLAGDIRKLAKQHAQNEQSMEEQARKMSEEARQLARQEIPQLAKAAKAAEMQTEKELARAAQALEKAANQMPQDFSKKPPAAKPHAGAPKAGEPKAGEPHAGAPKAGEPKAGEPHAGAPKAGEPHAGAPKAGAPHSGEAKAGEPHAGAPEAGEPQGNPQEQMQQVAQEMQAAQKNLEQAAQKAGQAITAAARQMEDAQAKYAKAKMDADAAAQASADRLADAAQQAAQAGSPPEALKDMQESAQAAAQRAAQSQAEAEQAANQVRAAQGQLAKTGGKPAYEQARSAADRAAELARQAQEMANRLGEAASQAASAMKQGARQQGQLTDSANKAGQAVARAGRHQSRLGREQGRALQQAGQKAQSTAQNEMSQAASAMSKPSSTPSKATTAMAEANKAAQESASEMKAAGSKAGKGKPGEGKPGEGKPGEPGEQSSEAAQWLARALDSLDQANAQQSAKRAGEPSNQASEQAKSAMGQASRKQAQFMADARNRGLVPGEPPKGGSAMFAQPVAMPEVDGPADIDRKDWGKLPRKLARDLMDASRENVPEEYKSMVDTYFEVIASKAKEGEK